ncbi:MAG: DUF3891 family protein, partial [Armatimonadetes bacterium]|nr:DUF3891 family protein [Armatimonadota bacterium]
MIVRYENGRLWLIMQTDHARLSGIMAAHWGNDRFRPLAARERTAGAIARHDDGWLVWEQDPRVNRETDRPFTFTEMPLDDALTIWYLGPKMAGERDPYAGLLVSLHGTYLLGSRLKNADDPPEAKERLRQYLRDQETLRERLQARLEQTEPVAAGELIASLDHTHRLLQLCDYLSLRFCMRPLMEGVQKHVLRFGMPDSVALQERPLDERTLTLAPWPFDTSELLLPTPVYDLP